MKDHKQIQQDQNIPGRPICGATQCHNGQLSHILSIIINAMADHYDPGTESDSTEDMIANIDRYNNARTSVYLRENQYHLHGCQGSISQPRH